MHFRLIVLVILVKTILFDVKGNEEEVESFFISALQCIESLQRHESNDFMQERLYRQLDNHTRTLSAFVAALSRYDPNNRDVSNLLESLYSCFRNLLLEHEAGQESTDVTNNFVPPTVLTGHPGRPRYAISSEQIYHCLSIGMTWQRIALCFGINRRTLYRHRQTLGVEPLRYSILSNQDLNRTVAEVLQNTPNAGETYSKSLRSRGLRIQRWCVRQSLWQVDPIGRASRRRRAIHRRIYNVHGPNHLW